MVSIGTFLSNIIKFQLQSQFQRLLNQPLCVYSQIYERYKTYQTGFSFSGLGHAPGVGLGGHRGGLGGGGGGGGGGVKIVFTKFNQSWCVSYLHEWHMQRHNFLGPRPPRALGRGQSQNIIKSQLLS